MQIDAEPLTGWGSPELIEQAAAGLRSTVQAVSTHATAAHEAWSALQEHYEGPEQETVYAGMDAPKATAADAADRGHQAAVALEQFASDLQDLEPRRSALVEDIAAFNESDDTEEEIHFGPGPVAEDQRSLHQTSLEDEISGLQGQYDLAVQVCVDRLNAIGVEPGNDGDSWTGYNAGAALWSTVWSSAPDVLTHTETVEERRTRWARYQRVFDVSSDGSATATYPYPVDEGSSTSRSSHRGFSLFGTSTTGGASDWWRRQESLRAQGLANFHESPASGSYETFGAAGQAFRNNLMGNVPGLAQYRAYRGTTGAPRPTPAHRFSQSVSRDATVKTETRTSRTNQTRSSPLGRGMHVSTSSLTLTGTIVTATVTYQTQKQQNLETLAQEHPDWSREEIEKEATHDAVANTTGRVAAEVVADAAVHTAVVAIPGVGPVATVVLGAGLSVAASAGINYAFMEDQDDDGHQDSISDRSGQGVESIWDSVRQTEH